MKKGERKRKGTQTKGNINKQHAMSTQQTNNTPGIPQLAQAAATAHYQSMLPPFPANPPFNYMMGPTEEPPWVKKILEKIETLNFRFSNLETQMNQKYEQLENSMSFLNNQFESLKTDIVGLKEENQQMKKEIKILKEEAIDSKSRSMRKNLLLHGVPENREENSETTVRQFVKDKLEIDTQDVEIERCHRIGPYQPGKCRPIVTNFMKFKDKETIKKASHKLKSTKYGLSDQFPKEIIARRKILRPIEKDIKSKGNPVYMPIDKLYTTGWMYYVDERGQVQKTASRRPVHTPRWQRQGQPAESPSPQQFSVSDMLTGAHGVLHGNDNNNV